MANKQKIAAIKLEGAMLQKTVRTPAIKSAMKQLAEDDSHLDDLQISLNYQKKILQHQNKSSYQTQKLKTAAALGVYRRQLLASQSASEFDNIAQAADTMLQGTFADGDEDDMQFWQQNSAKILDANRRDTERLREIKQPEFAKQNLLSLLADTQSVLAQIPVSHPDKIFEQGLQNIYDSSFLNDAEKESYKMKFLTDGILNLALQNPQAAETARTEFLADNESLKNELDNLSKLQKEDELYQANLRKRRDDFNILKNNFLLWQEKEKGNINHAAYYLFTNEEKFARDDEKYVMEKPLATAYNLMKNADDTVEKTKEIGDCLVSAYNRKNLEFDEVALLQNEVVGAKANHQKIFDEAFIDLTDKVFLEDNFDDTPEASQFMENKAKFAFELWGAYDDEKKLMEQSYINDGRTLTAGVKRRFEREAAAKVKDVFGLQEGDEYLSLNELKNELDEIYKGSHQEQIWQKFYKEMPYVSDKKMCLKKLALYQLKKEQGNIETQIEV